jgi:hypothetical protein
LGKRIASLFFTADVAMFYRTLRKAALWEED